VCSVTNKFKSHTIGNWEIVLLLFTTPSGDTFERLDGCGHRFESRVTSDRSSQPASVTDKVASLSKARRLMFVKKLL
jgi:hypothetical protein